MKNSGDTIGNRTSDLPACSTVLQPNALPFIPYKYMEFSEMERRGLSQKVYTGRIRKISMRPHISAHEYTTPITNRTETKPKEVALHVLSQSKMDIPSRCKV
jgi:hypothetical protein